MSEEELLIAYNQKIYDEGLKSRNDTENIQDLINERNKQNKRIEELVLEIERLNNIINELEENLREMYLTFGEFSEEYTEKKLKELKGE